MPPARKNKVEKVDKADAQPLDLRVEKLVDEVAEKGPITVRDLQLSLPWSRPTLRRVLREAERLGVIVRLKGEFRTSTPGRPSDVWALA